MNSATGKSMFTVVVLGLLLFVAGSVFGQDLLRDNPHTQNARRLRALAEQAIEEGEYEQAIAYTEEAERERELAVEWAERMVWAYRAANMRLRAREQMTYAQRIEAERHYPDVYAAALAGNQAAERAYQAQEYETAFEGFRFVRDSVSVLTPVRPAPVVAAPQPAPEPEVAPQPQPEPAAEPVLPRYYVVRLIPEDRDTFRKIAAYDFVYGDEMKWPILYRANRQVLRDPNNPDLIHPDMRFEIPSIAGERREGTWQPPSGDR